MTVDEDTRTEQKRRSLFVFVFSLVSGIGAGWLGAHINLFDKTRFQALHSMYSGFPFSPLFLASVLIGLFLAPIAANLFSRSGFSLWSLLPFAIWFGFGVDWINSHVNKAFISYEIETRAEWVVMGLILYVPLAVILFRLRQRQRRLAPLLSAGTAEGVWPPPPQIP